MGYPHGILAPHSSLDWTSPDSDYSVTLSSVEFGSYLAVTVSPDSPNIKVRDDRGNFYMKIAANIVVDTWPTIVEHVGPKGRWLAANVPAGDTKVTVTVPGVQRGVVEACSISTMPGALDCPGSAQ